MADEVVSLELDVNVADGAKSVADLKKNIKELKDAALQAGESGNTALAQKYTAAAAKARDRVNDLNKAVASLEDAGSKLGAFTKLGGTIASGFQAATGAAALFGSSGKNLEKVMLRVQAATALAQGTQALADAGKELGIVKTIALTTATSAYNVVVGTSTGLLKGLRIALAATGIGAIVIGVVALWQNFDKVTAALGKVKTALENAIPGVKQL